MTLERLRNVSLFFSIFAILMIAGVLLWATQAVNRAISINRAADQIRGAIQELNYLTVDTILHYEERSQGQWQVKQKALTALLESPDFNQQYRGNIDVITRNLVAAKELYALLVTYHHQAAVEKTLTEEQFRDLESRIVSRLLGQFQDMSASSARLGETSMQRILSSQFFLNVLLICFSIFISVIVLSNWAIISRKVLRPVRQLQKGAELVTNGDLAYRTGIKSTDEVGKLANAFDDMTEKIRTMLGQLEGEIRERIVVEEDLLESREQIRAVTETALDAIISADADGKIVHFNQGAEGMFNYGREAAIGMPFTQLFSSRWPPDLQQPQADCLGVIDKKRHENTFELTAMKGDGTEFPVEASTAAWSTARGNFFTMIIRDITFRKVSEERLHRINAELEAFSYSVSHDLRAPLRHIDGFVALLKEDCRERLSPECLEYLDYISDSATQMGNLIDDLLAFSQIGRVDLRKTWFDMADLVSEVQASMNTEVRGRHVEYRIDNLPKVFGDRSMLRQVWINLLSNALKYSRTSETALIEIGYVDRGSEVEFYIRDNGVGFDMKYVGKLFGVFHRLHRPEDFEGTGVGLANVQRIVQRHEGRVFAVGKVGQGATFYFTLPTTILT